MAQNFCQACYDEAQEAAFDSAYDLENIYRRIVSECEHNAQTS